MNIGMCGAHRTGKTTLAMELAQLTGKQFVRTRVTEVFKQHGLHAAQDMDFETRLDIQYRILEACEEDWQKAETDFITDRTPVDFLAYTLGDIQGKTEVNFESFETYFNRCIELSNRLFHTLIVLQPGIPLAEAEGKAALNKAYIEHINSLIIGLCHDQRVKSRIITMERGVIEFDERVRLISAAL